MSESEKPSIDQEPRISRQRAAELIAQDVIIPLLQEQLGDITYSLNVCGSDGVSQEIEFEYGGQTKVVIVEVREKDVSLQGFFITKDSRTLKIFFGTNYTGEFKDTFYHELAHWKAGIDSENLFYDSMVVLRDNRKIAFVRRATNIEDKAGVDFYVRLLDGTELAFQIKSSESAAEIDGQFKGRNIETFVVNSEKEGLEQVVSKFEQMILSD
jgi:hypothetical protein